MLFCVGLLHLRLDLIGLLLLRLELVRCPRVGRWRRNFSARGAGIRSVGQTVLPGIVRKRLKAGIKLFVEMIVHFLEVMDGDRYRLAGGAVRLLAALDAGGDVLVVIRGVREPHQHVPRRQAAFLAARPS